MYSKSTLTAVLISLLAATAAHAGEASRQAKIAEAQAKATNIFAEVFGKDKDGKSSGIFDEIFEDLKVNTNSDKTAAKDEKMSGLDSLFAKIFGAAAGSSSDEECVSAADGKHGSSNRGPNSGNGGKGGTVIIDGKAAKDGCYTANGGNGGSGNWSFGNNKVGGNGGDGGKIISR